MSLNSSVVVSRPLTLTVYWKSSPGLAGGCPTAPAGARMFCSLMTWAMSPAVTPSLLSLSGRTHSRME